MVRTKIKHKENVDHNITTSQQEQHIIQSINPETQRSITTTIQRSFILSHTTLVYHGINAFPAAFLVPPGASGSPLADLKASSTQFWMNSMLVSCFSPTIYLDTTKLFFHHNIRRTMNTAPIKWAQRRDSIYLTITLPDVKDHKIDLTSKNLTFEGNSNGKTYSLNLEFVSDVNIFE